MVHGELNILEGAFAQTLERIRYDRQLLKRRCELCEIGAAQLAEQGFLVRKVDVDGGR